VATYVANLHGDAARVIEMAALTERYLQEGHLNARGMVAYALAETYFAGDDMHSASRESLNMLKVGEETGWLLMGIPALCDLAATKTVQGRLHQAQEHYDRARQWMVDRKGLDSRVRCPYEIGLADLLRERNQLDAAHEHAVTGIEYSRRYGVYSLLVSAYVALMRVLQARGDVDGALDALRNAERVLQTHHVRLATRIELNTARVNQWLAVGDVETAGRWTEACGGGLELEQMALARLRLAQGRTPDAQRLLDRQRALAEAGGRDGRSIEMLTLLADGFTNKEIADRLVVAPSTVKQHLKNMYGKLDVHSRTQAVARGRELELL
jgi:LuxR family maltose regulon positive regulatory protein